MTGLPTPILVDHIRCEARRAIEDKAIELLAAYRSHGSEELAASLRADPSQFTNFKCSQLVDQTERKFCQRYIKTAIALNFTFDITEDNKANAEVDLLKPFTGGAFTLPLSAGGELMRENSRRFIVSDTFEGLINSNTLKCDGFSAQPNYAYPISGSIGLHELISTFVDLNEDKNLSFLDKTEVFADTLTFTTTVGATANPKATFVAGGNGFQVSSAPVMGSTSRIDKHAVIIGLSLGDPSDGVKKLAAAAPSTNALIPATQILTSNVGNASQRAIEATFQQRVNSFLDRFGN